MDSSPHPDAKNAIAAMAVTNKKITRTAMITSMLHLKDEVSCRFVDVGLILTTMNNSQSNRKEAHVIGRYRVVSCTAPAYMRYTTLITMEINHAT